MNIENLKDYCWIPNENLDLDNFPFIPEREGVSSIDLVGKLVCDSGFYVFESWSLRPFNIEKYIQFDKADSYTPYSHYNSYRYQESEGLPFWAKPNGTTGKYTEPINRPTFLFMAGSFLSDQDLIIWLDNNGSLSLWNKKITLDLSNIGLSEGNHKIEMRFGNSDWSSPINYQV